jgi:hypothetical protein
MLCLPSEMLLLILFTVMIPWWVSDRDFIYICVLCICILYFELYANLEMVKSNIEAFIGDYVIMKWL